MPISEDDLNYLRNINTRPGPNAGKSIDPTKPGPDADRASPEPQDVRERFARALYFASEGLAPESWFISENDAHWEQWKNDGDYMSPSALSVADALIAAFPALAQSNAEPVAWQHMFDLLKAARQMACRAVTASGGLDATPRTMLDIAALIGEAEEGLLTKPPLYTAPPRPDASAGLADRGVHGELIPDCPTDGVAARQGNGG